MSNALSKFFKKNDCPSEDENIQKHININIERYRLMTIIKIAGNQAHDANSPLCVINSALSSMERAFKSYNKDMSKEELINIIEQMKKHSEKISSNNKKITSIVNSLRTQTANIFNEYREEFKIKKEIESLFKNSDIQIKMKERACKYDINIEDELIITSYRKSFALILGNLIKNAIESYSVATNKNGEYLTDEEFNNMDFKRVEVSANKEDGYLLISVKDCGCGISKEVQQDIFFETMKNKTFKENAAGLSLFIAPTIVIGQLEGEIWFESKEGVGTTFYLSIPILCGERLNDEYKKILGVGEFATRKK